MLISLLAYSLRNKELTGDGDAGGGVSGNDGGGDDSGSGGAGNSGEAGDSGDAGGGGDPASIHAL